MSRSRLEGVTKRDFVEIAKVLCRNNAGHELIGDLSRYFKSANPNFAPDRFIEAAACKVKLAGARRRKRRR